MESDNPEKIPPSPETLYGSPGKEEIGRAKERGNADESRSEKSAHTIARSDQSTVGDAQDVEVENDVLERTITPKRPLVKVPRSQRRGLFSRFALVAEVTEPTDYKNSTKWFITFTVAIAAAAAPVGSGIIFRMLVSLHLVYGTC
jgi:hypothetical protein